MCAHTLDESLGVANEEKATQQHIKCFLQRIVQATAMALELYSMELFIIKSTKLVSRTYWNRAEKLDTNVGRDWENAYLVASSGLCIELASPRRYEKLEKNLK